jgi:hypothetical protein
MIKIKINLTEIVLCVEVPSFETIVVESVANMEIKSIKTTDYY